MGKNSTGDPTGRWKEIRDISNNSGQAWVKKVKDTSGEYEGVFARKIFKNLNRMDRIAREVRETTRLHSLGVPVVRVVDHHLPETPAKRDRPLSPRVGLNEHSNCRYLISRWENSVSQERSLGNDSDPTEPGPIGVGTPSLHTKNVERPV